MDQIRHVFDSTSLSSLDHHKNFPGRPPAKANPASPAIFVWNQIFPRPESVEMISGRRQSFAREVILFIR